MTELYADRPSLARRTSFVEPISASVDLFSSSAEDGGDRESNGGIGGERSETTPDGRRHAGLWRWNELLGMVRRGSSRSLVRSSPSQLEADPRVHRSTVPQILPGRDQFRHRTEIRAGRTRPLLSVLPSPEHPRVRSSFSRRSSHVLLFSLRPIDRDFLHHLQHRVNVIPVIAKADTLLKSELTTLKKQLLGDIDKHAVQLYDFPEGDSEQDDETQQLDKALKVRLVARLKRCGTSFCL